MAIRPSPVVALNRAIAVGQLEGPERGLAEIRSIANRERLAAYPFYSAALGDFELRRGKREIAREHFRAALALARNPMERKFLAQRVDACEDRPLPQVGAPSTGTPGSAWKAAGIRQRRPRGPNPVGRL